MKNNNNAAKTNETTNENNQLALTKHTLKRLNVQTARPEDAGRASGSWYSIIFLSCDGIC